MMDKDRYFRVRRYPPGCFSWVDCVTLDLPASVKFYSALLGWETDELSTSLGAFTNCRLRGEPVAALNGLSPDMGFPSAWNSHVTVADVDAAAARVSELGGELIEKPFDIDEQGRMCLLRDPQGATLSLWQPRAFIGAGLVNCAGAMVWNELLTPDRAASQAFYSGLFGWEFQRFDPEYDEIRNDGRANGGLDYGPDAAAREAAEWRVYFTVADMEKAAACVSEMGGEALTPIEHLHSQPRRLGVHDPAGAEIWLLELAAPEPWEEPK